METATETRPLLISSDLHLNHWFSKMIRKAFVPCILFTLSFALLACQRSGDENEDPVFVSHPDLRLGLTTQSFTGCVPVTRDDVLELVRFANEKGLRFMEIRDPEASLSVEDCKAIGSFAASCDIEVVYAIQKGLLDPDYWETFERALKNAKQFEGPPFFRAVANGHEFASDESKTQWTKEEFDRLVEYAEKSGQLAAEVGLTFVVENGYERISGVDGGYGLSDMLDATSAKVGWQYDVGNFFGVSRDRASVEEVVAFMDRYADRLAYSHLKASQNGENLPHLDWNELPFATLFEYFARHGTPDIAIELQCLNSAEEMYADIENGLKYLESEGLIRR